MAGKAVGWSNDVNTIERTLQTITGVTHAEVTRPEESFETPLKDARKRATEDARKKLEEKRAVRKSARLVPTKG